MADYIDVTDVIAQIKEGFAQAGLEKGQDNRLRIVSVRVRVEAVLQRNAGHGLTLRLPVIGLQAGVDGQVNTSRTHSLDMTFEPAVRNDPGIRGADVADEIVQAIQTLRTTMLSAATGSQPWDLQSSTFDLRFGVTKEGSISLGLTGGLSKEDTNVITLEIAPV